MQNHLCCIPVGWNLAFFRVGKKNWSKAWGCLGLWRTLSRSCRCAGTSRQRSQELSQLLHVTAAAPCVLLPASQGCCQALGGEISRVLSLSGQLTLGVEQNPALLPLQSPAEGSGREQGGIKTATGVNSRIPPSTTCRCWEGKHPECVFFLDVYREEKVHGEQKTNLCIPFTCRMASLCPQLLQKAATPFPPASRAVAGSTELMPLFFVFFFGVMPFPVAPITQPKSTPQGTQCPTSPRSCSTPAWSDQNPTTNLS